jgi:hypothetical protein
MDGFGIGPERGAGGWIHGRRILGGRILGWRIRCGRTLGSRTKAAEAIDDGEQGDRSAC